MSIFDALSSTLGMHKKRYKHRVLTGNHNIYRASNPSGGSAEAGFTPPEKTPDNMEALVARVVQQQGYEAGNKDPGWANFTFSEDHAANYAVNRQEPNLFLVRVSKSKALKNHRHNLDAGIQKEDFYLERLEPNELYAIVVPPKHEKQIRKILAKEGMKRVSDRVTSPPKWLEKKDVADIGQLVKARKKILSQYLSSL